MTLKIIQQLDKNKYKTPFNYDETSLKKLYLILMN